MTHVLGVPIPEELTRSAAKWGDAGTRWLSSLTGRVTDLVDRWDLEIEVPTCLSGQCSIVVPCRRADELCVLKVQWPHEEAEHEADALRAYGGDGAARLHDADDEHNALLIERCEPGSPAWLAGDREDVVRVCADVMRRLWLRVDDDAPFDRRALAGVRAENIRRRFVEFGRPFDADLARAGADTFDSLAASAPREVLLHGDFHPNNVLRAQREPWLAIDPKPLVGDPAFDCAQLVLNFFGEDWPIETMVAAVAAEVDVDRERVWGWTFARTVEEITWSLVDGQPIERDVERATDFASLRP